MSRRRYPDRPDGFILDADRGSGSARVKQAVPVMLQAAATREDTRAGLQELDAMVEAARGLTRSQRDAARTLPRGTPAPIGHPVMERQLQPVEHQREPLSGRQQKARRKLALRVQHGLPQRQFASLDALMEADEVTWRRVNDHLSDAVGDIEALPDDDAAEVRRVDRVIQAYEDRSDRGHVVYANVAMPTFVNRSSLAPYVRNAFQHGDELAFDRYTGAVHSLHEASALPDPGGRIAVFEIQTRRGIYLGKSEGTDRTGHLLPRGMTFRVVDVAEATYRDRQGRTGKRVLIRLQDTTPEPAH